MLNLCVIGHLRQIIIGLCIERPGQIARTGRGGDRCSPIFIPVNNKNGDLSTTYPPQFLPLDSKVIPDHDTSDRESA
jgi:hypothetical protein